MESNKLAYVPQGLLEPVYSFKAFPVVEFRTSHFAVMVTVWLRTV